jgi:hypothetical protein
MKWSTAKPFFVLVGIVVGIVVAIISYMIETRPREKKSAPIDPAEPGRPRVVTVTPLPASPPKISTVPGNAPASAQTGAQWDEKINGLLTDQAVSVREASRQFLTMATDTTGPDKQRTDSVRHGLTLLDDADYLEFALPLATQTALNKEMQEVIMSDLFNRPPTISVPVADAIVAVPNHPLAEEAKELAEFFKSAAAADGN